MVMPFNNQIGVIDPRNGQILGPGQKPLQVLPDGTLANPVMPQGTGNSVGDILKQVVDAATSTAANPASPNPTGATGGTPETGMSGYTGFAGQYAPGMLGSVFDAPTSILPDVFSGLDKASPLYQVLAGMQADPLSLYTLLVGAGQGFEDTDVGTSAFVNWLAEMYKQLGTAGGQGFNISNMLGNLFGTNTGEESSSALNQALRAGDPIQQSRFLYNMVRDAANVGMNPVAAMGYQSGMARAMDSWRNESLKGDSGSNLTPLEWIKANAPHLVVGI